MNKIMPFGMAKKEKKKKLIVVGINSLVATKHQPYSNHIQFFYNLGKCFPKYNFMLHNPDRMSIDRMRNATAEIAMSQGAEYMLFLDDDVLIPMDALNKLLAMKADVASADVCIRGYPFDHMLFQWKNKSKTGLIPMKSIKEPRGVIDCGAVGFSLCLIKVSLLLKMHKPLFVTGLTNTEDIYFCLRAKQEVPDVTIKADTTLICPHMLWHETISSFNKKAFKRYYETAYPEQAKANKESISRGIDYLKMVKGITKEKPVEKP